MSAALIDPNLASLLRFQRLLLKTEKIDNFRNINRALEDARPLQ